MPTLHLQELTNWAKSPSASREGNRDCVLLGFYDAHDLWHFASSFALAFSFLILLSLDDRQQGRPRDALRVF